MVSYAVLGVTLGSFAGCRKEQTPPTKIDERPIAPPSDSVSFSPQDPTGVPPLRYYPFPIDNAESLSELRAKEELWTILKLNRQADSCQLSAES